MPPRSEHLTSTLKIKPPPNRSPTQSGEEWLKDKNLTDGAEGLWRVHDKLYDVSKFIDNHPGGAEWLELTKGTDITEAFEVHHLTSGPEELLKKYYVREARTKRNSPFTFKDDGFYRTLKREIINQLKNPSEQPIRTSAFFTDTMLVFLFLFATLANTYWSYKLGLIAGSMLGLLTIAAHNYFHKKDNLRMLYFNFSLMQTREWRISHVLSHHLHTNTIDDMEITMSEPLVQFLPKEKTSVTKYLPWILQPFVWIISFHWQFVRRVSAIIRGNRGLLQWYDFVPFTLPLVMYFLSDNKTIFETLWMWTFIVMTGSFHFFAVGTNAAHHHPDIFHDGDTPRSDVDYDWGLSQLDALMDRKEITGSHFLVLTNFGDHALHHLFPTLDHGTLDFLYPTFKEVCRKFNADIRMASQFEMIKGQFLQAARTQPNPNPPDLLKKY